MATSSDVKRHRRNQEIRVSQVRVINAEGQQVGILSRDEALGLAEAAGLDLVEIQPLAEPPVCRIMDFGKFRFDQQKKSQAAKKKQRQIEIKEVKFRPTTDVGDYQIKLRNILRFLTDGDKVKVTIRFRGRELSHKELGFELAQKVQQDVAELAVVEQFPRLEGRQMVMLIAPKQKS